MTNIKEKPIWRVYPEIPFIEVNQFGEIRTKDRTVTRGNGRRCFVKGRVLKQQRDRHGYMYVGISVNGKSVKLKVHRIVTICFFTKSKQLSRSKSY